MKLKRGMKCILVLAFVFVYIDAYPQCLEGTLVYVVTYEPLIKGVRGEQIKSDTVKYVYSGDGDYAIVNLSDPSVVSVYKAKDHFIYALDRHSPIVTAVDARVDLEAHLGHNPEVILVDSVLELAGRKTKIVEVRWRTGTYRYYYSPKFLTNDAKCFENHLYDQWYGYLKLSQALPVRVEKITDGLMKICFDLLHYESTTPDPSIFKLPQLSPNKELERLFPYRKVFNKTQ